jgi:small subunit ribosomal protein S20
VPHHTHFKKTLKQDVNRRLRNRAAKSRLSSIIKKVRAAATKEEAQTILTGAVSVIDSTARKGIIKKGTASRKVSRLARFVNRMA